MPDDLNELRFEVAKWLGWTDLSYEQDRGESIPCGNDPDDFRVRVPDWPNDPGAAARDLLAECSKRGWAWYLNHEVGWYRLDANEQTGIVSQLLGEAISRGFLAALRASQGEKHGPE